MKQRFILSAVILALTASMPLKLAAQEPFTSGSDGSDGALVVSATTTLQLPPDGIFNFTTIEVQESGELRFARNSANTPAYLLATGDITILGRINIDGGDSNSAQGGEGGPGGFDGGTAGPAPGHGFGPGGGKGGWYSTSISNPDAMPYRGSGGFASPGRAQGGTPESEGKTYGNSLLIPMVGGSGGGGGTIIENDSSIKGGGGGGGALLIASSTRIIFGTVSNDTGKPIISLQGGRGDGRGFGYGSGGALRLIAPTVEKQCYIQQGSSFSGSGNDYDFGGYGRVRVDALQRDSLELSFRAGGGISRNYGASYTTYGANMVVFPPNIPEIRLTNAAGQTIPETQTDPVFVLLPPGSPETQSITVQVSGFGTNVPLTAVVTPESGTRSTTDFEIDNTGGGSSQASVNLQIPAGAKSRIDVWSR